MKAFKLIILSLVLLLAGTLQGQISFNLHFGSPPQWGPADQPEARYYYLPDVEAYYDLQTSMFIYLNNGRWVRHTYLPARYRNYDLYNGYKVVMTNYRGNTPYTNFREYRTKYARGYHGQPQRTIREKQGRGNPHQMMRPNERQRPDNHNGREHGNEKNNKNDHGNGNDQGNGHGNGHGHDNN